MAESCRTVPEFNLFDTGTFVLKVFLCTGNRRGDAFSSCDLSEMWVKFAGCEEELAGCAVVSKISIVTKQHKDHPYFIIRKIIDHAADDDVAVLLLLLAAGGSW